MSRKGPPPFFIFANSPTFEGEAASLALACAVWGSYHLVYAPSILERPEARNSIEWILEEASQTET